MKTFNIRYSTKAFLAAIALLAGLVSMLYGTAALAQSIRQHSTGANSQNIIIGHPGSSYGTGIGSEPGLYAGPDQHPTPIFRVMNLMGADGKPCRMSIIFPFGMNGQGIIDGANNCPHTDTPTVLPEPGKPAK